MRISCVTETWPPEINGVALTVARSVAYLRERGHALEVIRPRQGRTDGHEAGTWTVPGLPVPFYSGLRCGWPVRRRLLRHWRRNAPELVHVATEGPLGWAALSAARQLRLPVTTDFRTRFDRYGQLYSPACAALVSQVILAWLRRFHNRALCTFVPTGEMLQQLEAHGFRNLVINGRGVDTDLFNPRRRSPALRACWQADGPVALYVGRLAREKNLEVVVAAWRAMRATCPRMRLVLVGDGPLRKVLQRRCPEAIFAGVHSGALLAAHYASADIFLFPSLTETFGNVTLEALASGLAVVAYGSGAAGLHIRDRLNGYLAPPGDAAAFIAAAVALAGDRDQRERVGRAAAMAARACSWDRVLADFEATLLDARALGVFDDAPCLA